MIGLPTLSLVIPTRDRAEVLTNLLKDIVKQISLPIEVVIVGDSPLSSAENVAGLFSPQFKSISCSLFYLKGPRALY